MEASGKLVHRDTWEVEVCGRREMDGNSYRAGARGSWGNIGWELGYLECGSMLEVWTSRRWGHIQDGVYWEEGAGGESVEEMRQVGREVKARSR